MADSIVEKGGPGLPGAAVVRVVGPHGPGRREFLNSHRTGLDDRPVADRGRPQGGHECCESVVRPPQGSGAEAATATSYDEGDR